eukprot:gene11117-14921_t
MSSIYDANFVEILDNKAGSSNERNTTTSNIESNNSVLSSTDDCIENIKEKENLSKKFDSLNIKTVLNPLNDDSILNDDHITSKLNFDEKTKPEFMYDITLRQTNESLRLTYASSLAERLKSLLLFHQNPLFWLSLSILYAWVFAVLPDINKWVFTFVVVEWWAILCVIGNVEIMYACMPDASIRTYVFAYIFGIVVCPLVNLVNLVTSYNNTAVATVSVTTTMVAITIVFAIEAISFPNSKDPLLTTFNNLLNVSLHDTFSASLDITVIGNRRTELIELGTNSTIGKQSISLYRRNWLLVQQQSIDSINNITNIPATFPLYGLNSVDSVSNSTNVQQNYKNNTNLLDQILSVLLIITPRYLYTIWGVDRGVVTGDRRLSLIFGFTFNSIFALYYTFLQFFTAYFRANEKKRIILFWFYIIIGNGVRGVTKRICMMADRNKLQSVSMFFIGEWLCLFFYYTFYRVLFESVREWQIFFALQVLHLGTEWILYPVRASVLFFNFMERIRTRKDCLRYLGVLFNTDGLDHQDWLAFISLDFGIRCATVITSAIGISILLLTIQYSPWASSVLKESNSSLNITLGLIAVAVVLEILNAIAMSYFYFRTVNNNIGIRQTVEHCFRNSRFGFISSILAGILFINPVYAFSKKYI